MRPFPFNRRIVDRRGKYRWLRMAVIVPALVSLMVHAGGAIWARAYSWALDRPDRLTDRAGVETILTLEQPEVRPPDPTPAVVPEPPPPPKVELRAQPRPEPKPEPKREPIPVPPPEAKPAEPVRPPPAPTTEVTIPTRASDPATAPAPAQPPAPAPPPLPATFAGVKADVAGRVVYVVDASGSMTTSLPFVLEELSRSIDRLDEAQSFQVILFREPPPDAGGSVLGYEMFRPGAGLVPATRANKDAARAWAHTIRPLGKSAPLPGLGAALSLQPDLVFLLSRSIRRTATERGVANQGVLRTLDELNPVNPFTGKRRVVIKTIQFIEDDPSGLLQAIAVTHGDGSGSYKLLPLEELTGR